ncbi:unnamed protein product [Ambrosiozyma monospora]|uniref:Unnamed protein product n=1 Tax=Ambrosiozyma monospora TaxID=43982 RepID=A0ACB5SXS0_AMBMO|nr:unnamed protein product [Ambrosiozyma monospora]
MFPNTILNSLRQSVKTGFKQKSSIHTSSALLNQFTRLSRPTSASSNSFLKLSAISGAALATTALTLYGLGDNLTNDDKPTDLESTIVVDSTVDPFPLELKTELTTPFQMIGSGIRTVTFMRMRVYALGLYLATEDIPLVKRIWHSKFIKSFYEQHDGSDAKGGLDPEASHAECLKHGLNDPRVSSILVNNLLNSGVRLAARIVPVRNTDFNHLRDGLTKTIKNSELYKELNKTDEESAERLAKGLHQLHYKFHSNNMAVMKVSIRISSLVLLKNRLSQNVCFLVI